MFKRLVWLLMGMILGTGQTLWLMRRLRRTINRVRPSGMSTTLGEGLSSLGRDVRSAIAEGRVAMNEREAELRAKLAGRQG